MKTLFKTFALLVVMSMLLAACQTTPSTPAVDSSPAQPNETEASQSNTNDVSPVKVGILLPMTGQDALNGQVHLNAFTFGADEINAAGGIACLGGAPIELVVGDSQGRSGKADHKRRCNCLNRCFPQWCDLASY
jgi:ABC-type branched-subunit amino acid transport system substrate-binding protein